MKRLIASLAVSLGLVLANVSSVAAARFWELQMFEPAATTSRTVNIEFKVMSTEKSDTFKVELFENGSTKEVKNITTPNGDSGVFSVALPASGTYTYKIDATNNGNASTDTESRTVQVIDGPAPTVTTVFVNNGAGGQGADGTQAAAVGGTGAGGANAAGGAGEVAGAAANEGQVNAEGSSTDEKTEGENQGDVLGESDNTTASNNRRRNITLGIAVVLAAAGAAYYWFLARPRNSA